MRGLLACETHFTCLNEFQLLVAVLTPALAVDMVVSFLILTLIPSGFTRRGSLLHKVTPIGKTTDQQY